MIVSTLETEICDCLRQLPVEQKRQVLEFVRLLATAPMRGVPGEDMLRFCGTINSDDLAIMAKTIEADCGQVHDEDW